MIKVTRLNGSAFYINPLLIETLEETPDTIVLLTTGKKYVVKENAREITIEIKNFLNQIGLLKSLYVYGKKESNS